MRKFFLILCVLMFLFISCAKIDEQSDSKLKNSQELYITHSFWGGVWHGLSIPWNFARCILSVILDMLDIKHIDKINPINFYSTNTNALYWVGYFMSILFMIAILMVLILVLFAHGLSDMNHQESCVNRMAVEDD